MEYVPNVYTGDTEPFVFISYSHKNKELVYADLAVMEKRHVRFWCDYGIPPGDEWDTRVHRTIQKPNCTGAIFYLSTDSLSSEAVHKELRFWDEKLRENDSFSYIPHFAVLTEHSQISNLFSDALTRGGDKVLDILGVVTKLFKSNNLYVLHPNAASQVSMPAYYDQMIKGVDVFSARRIDKVRGEYCCNFEDNADGVTVYPSAIGTETSRVIPDVMMGTRVVKIGDRAFAGDMALYEVQIPWGVRHIGAYAFAGCKNLTNVILPDTVETIGERAFYGCTGIERLELPGKLQRIGKTAFAGCEKLSAISLPGTLQGVPSECFKLCKGLTQAELADGICQIDPEAFYGCESLTDIAFPNTVIRLGRDAFRRCSGLQTLYVPETVTQLNEGAFEDCTALHTAVVLGGRESIARELFMGCTALKRVEMAPTVEQIRESAFEGCSALTEVKLPDALQSIHDRAFLGCKELVTLHLPANLRVIGRMAFFGDAKLRQLCLPPLLERLGTMALTGCDSLHISLAPSETGVFSYHDGMLFDNEDHALITVDASVSAEPVIPADVVVLRPGAFFGSGIRSLQLPERIREIGQYAVFGMNHLTQLWLPDGVSKIGNGNFSACHELRAVRLPGSVKRFGGNLFRDCPKLERVTYDGVSGVELGLCCFENVPAMQHVFVAPGMTERLCHLRGWEEARTYMTEGGQ